MVSTSLDWIPIGIKNFKAQTYPNCKLYIVWTGLGSDVEQARSMVKQFGITFCDTIPSFSQDELVAEWKEQTVYHPIRLAVQRLLLEESGLNSVGFGQQLIFVKCCPTLIRISPIGEQLSRLYKYGEDGKTSFDGMSSLVSSTPTGLQLLSCYVAKDLTDSYIKTVRGQTWEPHQNFELYMQTHRDEFAKQVKLFVERFL